MASFSQIGLTPGVYTVTVISQANNLNYSEKHQFSSGEDNDVTINFKAILAQQGANPEQEKKQAGSGQSVQKHEGSC